MIPFPVFSVRMSAEGVICSYYVPQGSLTSVHYCSDTLLKDKLPGHRARWHTVRDRMVALEDSGMSWEFRGRKWPFHESALTFET
jgi:hypothetical protein